MFSATLPNPLLAIFYTSLCVLVASLMFGRKPKWDPKGKHCYVTGGSSGLGLSLAILLAKRGAHVSIVARNQEKLDQALKQLEAARRSPEQLFHAYSFSVDRPEGAEASFEASAVPFGGKCPDAVFLCAGKSQPGFFVEKSEDQLVEAMQETYWSQAWCAFVASKRMVREGVKGRIVFVASVLAYMSIVGYSSYASGKFAIRGLAESLQSEFKLYGISIHICFPGTIFTPGYVEENKLKPKITLKLEESDGGIQPEPLAVHLLDSVSKGRFHITYDFIGNVFRASTRGSSPGSNGFMDQVYALIGAIALPFWRRDVDSHVHKHREEHYDYLRAKGLINSDVVAPA